MALVSVHLCHGCGQTAGSGVSGDKLRHKSRASDSCDLTPCSSPAGFDLRAGFLHHVSTPGRMMVSYSKRENFFQKAEWTWMVEDAGLRVRDCHGADYLVPWSDVTAIRIATAPTNMKPWRQLMALKLRAGGEMVIDNVHFAGVGEFQYRAETFAPFVRTVVEKLAARSPDMQCNLGAQTVGYWTSMALLTAGAIGLGLVLLAVPFEGIPGIAWIKIGLVAAMVPALILWIVKARPRGVRITEVPESALPRAFASAPSRQPAAPRTE